MSDNDSTSDDAKAKRAERKRKYLASEHGKAVTAAYNKRYGELHKAELAEKARRRLASASEEKKEHVRKLTRERRARKRDQINEQRRIALQSKPELRERAKARSKEWQEKNKERVRQKAADYYRENRAAVMAKIKAYEAKNQEKAAGWRSSRVHARRARILGSEGKFTKADIDRIMKLQKCKCANCGKSLKGGHHIDHRIPVSKGGSNGPENIELLCPPCNYSKGAKLPHVFAQENGRLL